MKRYLAFVGDICYPSGGMRDFFGDYDNIEDAIKDIENYSKEEEEDWSYSWARIYDTVAREEAWTK